MFKKLFKNKDTTSVAPTRLGVRDRHALKKYGNVPSTKYGNIQLVGHGHRARKQQLAALIEQNSSFFYSDTRQPKKTSFLQKIKLMFGAKKTKPTVSHKKGVKYYY